MIFYVVGDPSEENLYKNNLSFFTLKKNAPLKRDCDPLEDQTPRLIVPKLFPKS